MNTLNQKKTAQAACLVSASASWLEEQEAELMRIGYVDTADESLTLMQEFRHVDEEGWG